MAGEGGEDRVGGGEGEAGVVGDALGEPLDAGGELVGGHELVAVAGGEHLGVPDGRVEQELGVVLVEHLEAAGDRVDHAVTLGALGGVAGGVGEGAAGGGVDGLAGEGEHVGGEELVVDAAGAGAVAVGRGGGPAV